MILSIRSWALSVMAVLVLSACGGGSSSSNYKGVKIGKPYSVAGEWYTPKYEPYYEETGLASWYGPGFHGKKTSYGESFDTGDLTAAHRTLPLPSLVEVTNLANDKKVVVRINDRGPFSKGRIIDVSKAAAEKLGMIKSGTAQVRVRYLPDATEQYVANHGGSMRDYQNAQEKADRLAGTAMVGGPSIQAAPVYTTSSRDLAPLTPVTEGVIGRDLSPPGSPGAQQGLPTSEREAAAQNAATSDEDRDEEVASLMPTPVPVMANVPVGGMPDTRPAPGAPKAGHYYVQVAAFGMEENAKKTANQLSMYGTPTVAPVQANGRTLYRVRLGPLKDADAAQQALEQVASAGFQGAKVVH